MSTMISADPIVKQIEVEAPVSETFETFTSGISDWWPTHSHSVGGDDLAEVVLEGGVDGRIFERWKDGQERDWGRVTKWDPPNRVAFLWHPGLDPSQATEVEIVFEGTGETTRVELTHRGWELISLGSSMRASYDSGWDEVLGYVPKLASV